MLKSAALQWGTSGEGKLCVYSLKYLHFHWTVSGNMVADWLADCFHFWHIFNQSNKRCSWSCSWRFLGFWHSGLQTPVFVSRDLTLITNDTGILHLHLFYISVQVHCEILVKLKVYVFEWSAGSSSSSAQGDNIRRWGFVFYEQRDWSSWCKSIR